MPVILWLALRRATSLRSARRAGYFAKVQSLFDGVISRVEPSGFARMAGGWQGMAMDLQVVQDTLTFRKLPTLWLLVTVTGPQPVTGEMHIMARPGQNDIFSRFGQMPVSVALPQEFPDHCALRCDDAARLPAAGLVARQAQVFSDPAVKELVIAPNGLRLVVLCDEAERGRYLLFREAELGQRPLAAETLLPYLAALKTLHDTLSEADHD